MKGEGEGVGWHGSRCGHGGWWTKGVRGLDWADR